MKNSMGHKFLLWVAACLVSTFSMGALAAQVSYTYTGTWSSFYTGDFGSTYEATVIFDNGGTDVANQTFEESDFVSARLVSGSYDFTMLPDDITYWSSNFTSDGSGVLGNGWFDAANGDHSWHFDNDYQDENFFQSGSGNAGFFESHTSNRGQLVIMQPVQPVPTMQSFGLLFLILSLMLVASRHLGASRQWR